MSIENPNGWYGSTLGAMSNSRMSNDWFVKRPKDSHGHDTLEVWLVRSDVQYSSSHDVVLVPFGPTLVSPLPAAC